MSEVELTKQEELRLLVCSDLWAYAQYILPLYAFGDIHRDCFRQMSDPDRVNTVPNLLLLIPRDHLKSVMAAVYCTWRIACDPTYTIMYVTADEDLGRLQMSFMKNIFESDRFRYLFPDHFEPEVGRREKWTGLAISSSHPLRKELNIRDETIVCKTVKSGKTGRHPKEIVFDDLVVPENAYTEVGRNLVREAASQLSSMQVTGGLMTAVGTRYHLGDQYALWMTAMYEVFDDEGHWIEDRPLWAVTEKQVENAGDGSGHYLWPRTKTASGAWYGWDRQSLARKKAEYTVNGQLTQYFAQYYMEPNDPGSHRLKDEDFKYADRRHLEYHQGIWYYDKKKLNILAVMDVAITDAAAQSAIKADYTAILVLGQDTEGFYYVLDMIQFQTDKRSVYYKELVNLWKKWEFKRIYIEMEQAGKIVGQGIQEDLINDQYSLIVDGNNAPRGIAKHERHASIAIPKYEQGAVFHFKGGYTGELEEQLKKPRPAHDDLLDCVTMGIEHIKKPQSRSSGWGRGRTSQDNVLVASNRFGGRR